MVHLIKLSVDDLLVLKEMYKVKWPLHIATYSIIDIFARRFVEHLEWMDKVAFYGVESTLAQCGTVIMIHTRDKVFFDTLDPRESDNLRRALLVVDLDPNCTFISIRDCFRPLLLDIIRIRRFRICHETGSKYYLFPTRLVRQLTRYYTFFVY